MSFRSKSLVSYNRQNNNDNIKNNLKDELKENLLKESINFNKTIKFTMKDSNQFSNSETLCNFSNDMMSTRDKTTYTIIKNMLDLKKSKLNLSREIFDKEKNLHQKEKIIIQMNEELNCHLNENTKLKIDLESIKQLKNECEINRIGVTQYCQNLKSKFKKFVEIIEKYENKIESLKKQREQIIKTSEAIIEMKIKDKIKIEEEIDRTNMKIDNNVNLILEMEIKLEEFIRAKEDQRIRFSELDRIEKIKIEDLERKHKNLTNKLDEYQLMDDVRESEIYVAFIKNSKEIEEKENMRIKLKECQLKNELLQKQFNEVNDKYNDMSSILEHYERKLSEKNLIKQGLMKSKNSLKNLRYKD